MAVRRSCDSRSALAKRPRRAAVLFREQITTFKRLFVAEGPLSGPFCCGDRHARKDHFFQNQAQECRRLAAQATGKNDREYWLRLAQRWEWLVHPQKNRVAEVEAIRPLRPERSVAAKRFGKRRAAA
jgi:hypothetical protein